MKTIRYQIIRTIGLCLYLVGWNYIRDFAADSSQRTSINLIGVGVIYLFVFIEINLREQQKFGLSKPNYKSMFYYNTLGLSAIILFLLLKK
jgi:hypothetical protein